jgi:hypothetical protein
MITSLAQRETAPTVSADVTTRHSAVVAFRDSVINLSVWAVFIFHGVKDRHSPAKLQGRS